MIKKSFKKFAAICLSAAMILTSGIVVKPLPVDAASGVAINSKNFPDSQFRKGIKLLDTNNDNKLSPSEAKKIKYVSAYCNAEYYGQSVSLYDDSLYIEGGKNIKGIQYLTAINHLTVCYDNQATMDLTKNKNLQDIYISACKAKTLKFKGLTKVKSLILDGLTLSKIDISSLSNLKTLSISYCNKLKTVTTGSKNKKLNDVSSVYSKSLTSMNLSSAKSLTSLQTNTKNFDINKCKLGAPKKLKTLELSYNPKAAKVNYSKYPNLTKLDLHNSGASSINVATNTKLEHLDLTSNKLTSVDVSKNTKLKILMLSNNSINSIDTSSLTKLTSLELQNNNISALDLSNNSKLIQLWLNNNPLKNIDLSMLKNLHSADIYSAVLEAAKFTPSPNLNSIYANPATQLQFDEDAYTIEVRIYDEYYNLTTNEFESNGVINYEDIKADGSYASYVLNHAPTNMSCNIYYDR